MINKGDIILIQKLHRCDSYYRSALFVNKPVRVMHVGDDYITVLFCKRNDNLIFLRDNPCVGFPCGDEPILLLMPQEVRIYAT